MLRKHENIDLFCIQRVLSLPRLEPPVFTVLLPIHHHNVILSRPLGAHPMIVASSERPRSIVVLDRRPALPARWVLDGWNSPSDEIRFFEGAVFLNRVFKTTNGIKNVFFILWCCSHQTVIIQPSTGR